MIIQKVFADEKITARGYNPFSRQREKVPEGRMRVESNTVLSLLAPLIRHFVTPSPHRGEGIFFNLMTVREQHKQDQASLIEIMLTSSTGTSPCPMRCAVFTLAIASTTSMPSTTSPKTQ